jgi:hypothetical protein
LFPGVEIQPKGLLATEAFVSLPLVGESGCPLAVRSHFFEFEEAAGGAIKLAHALDHGGRYRVIVTTAGGLYRYALRDEIEVVGFRERCPLLRFLGKCDVVSDLVGEKLGEPHVRLVLERSLVLQQLAPRFVLLTPILNRPHYRLYVQCPMPAATDILRLCREVSAGLEENPYYRHAVALGQLDPLDVAILDDDGEPAWLAYERRALETGQKSGNIKPVALDPWPGWADRLPRPSAISDGREGDTPPNPAENR